MNDSDGWAVSLVEIESVGGARLLYHTRQDANGVDQPLWGPGADRPFNTFLSTPRAQFAASRFDAAATALGFAPVPLIVEPSRYSGGLAIAGSPISPAAPRRAILRIAFEAPTSGGAPSFGDIYFVAAASNGRGDPNTALPIEPDHTRVLTLRTDHSTPPWLPPSYNGAFFAVPEPASFALLALGAALGFRQR